MCFKARNFRIVNQPFGGADQGQVCCERVSHHLGVADGTTVIKLFCTWVLLHISHENATDIVKLKA